MSRRPDNKAAQNQQTIKSLLKLEANKMCADCKKNKHPRWASWNLGIFICIRCSGIHRGMGTHISRVKSVDLDAWTDEQLQSIIRWGNARANKYWEAKLAAGHVPSDAKIENFIRTKYESKRWVMDGPMPDPSTLGDDGDDNVPLNVVRDKAQLDRSASQRTGAVAGPASAGLRRPHNDFDLIGADEPPPPPRPSTTDLPQAAGRAPPAAVPPPAKASTPSQLLGGLDFLGDTPERPASTGQKPGGMSRPDLKQSILSLYAAQPKPAPQSPPAQQTQNQQSSFGGLGGGPAGGSSFGGMNDAFASLSFTASPTASSSRPAQQSHQPTTSTSSFGGLGQMSMPTKGTPAAPQMSSPPLSGGGFFDAGPRPPPKSNTAPKPTAAAPAPAPSLGARKISNASDGFGDFASSMTAAPAPSSSSTSKPSNNNAGLLDFTTTMVNLQPVASKPPSSSATATDSIFNLSQPKSTAAPAQVNYASKISSDPWATDAWATPDPAPAPSASRPPQPSGTDFGWGSSSTTTTTAANSSGLGNEWSQPATSANVNYAASSAAGWGGGDVGFGGGSSTASAGPPKVAAEEDFGGWASSTGPATSTGGGGGNVQGSGAAGGGKAFAGGSDDLFSNVWG